MVKSIQHDLWSPLKMPSLTVGLTREVKDYMAYTMKKAGAFEVVDKKNAVGELYDAIRRALAGIDGKAVHRPEIGPGLGFMTEAT
jgi:hypothetical protein